MGREQIVLNNLDKEKRNILNISKKCNLSYEHTKSALKIFQLNKLSIGRFINN